MTPIRNHLDMQITACCKRRVRPTETRIKAVSKDLQDQKIIEVIWKVSIVWRSKFM